MVATTAGQQADLEREILAFERLSPELESHYKDKWVVIRDEALVGAFDTLDAAAELAVTKFGRGPYLIRQVGAPPFALPASLIGWAAVPQCRLCTAASPTMPSGKGIASC